MSPKKPLTWPAITSVMAGAAPLYGTCSRLSFAASFSSSIARCGTLPVPDEASVSLDPGCFAAATNSAPVLYGALAPTTSTSTLFTTSDTGTRSRSTS
jgi:hypothetical protein